MLKSVTRFSIRYRTPVVAMWLAVIAAGIFSSATLSSRLTTSLTVPGIWKPALGTLASICLVAYFAGALLSHAKKKHKVADFGAALGIFIIAIVTTYLQLKR